MFQQCFSSISAMCFVCESCYTFGSLHNDTILYRILPLAAHAANLVRKAVVAQSLSVTAQKL